MHQNATFRTRKYKTTFLDAGMQPRYVVSCRCVFVTRLKLLQVPGLVASFNHVMTIVADIH